MYWMSILFSNFQIISYYCNKRVLDFIPVRYQFSFNQYCDTTQTKQQCQKRNKSFPSFSIHHSTAHHKSVIKKLITAASRFVNIFTLISTIFNKSNGFGWKKNSVRNEIWQRSLKSTFEEMSNAIFVIIGNCHECAMQKKDEVTRSWLLAFVCWTSTNLYWCKQTKIHICTDRYEWFDTTKPFTCFFSSFFFSIHLIFFFLPIIFLLFTQRCRVHTNCLKIMQRCDILVSRAYFWSVSSFGLVFHL